MIIHIHHISGEIIELDINDDENENHILQKLASLLNLPPSILTVFKYNDQYSYVIEPTAVEIKKNRMFYKGIDPFFICDLMIKNSRGECLFNSYFAYNLEKKSFFSSNKIETEECFDRYSREYYLSIHVIGNGENSIDKMIEKDDSIPDYFKKKIVEMDLFHKNSWIHP